MDPPVHVRVVTHRVGHARGHLPPAPGPRELVANERVVISPPLQPRERSLVVTVQVTPAPFPILQRGELRLE
jgi:hypothetical protein